MIFATHAKLAHPHHHQIWLPWNPTKMDWFFNQTFPTLFLLHL